MHFSFHIRLSFDEVDKRCRRVPIDAPGKGPLSTEKQSTSTFVPKKEE